MSEVEKPHRKGQFVPGKSGNPGGRAKGEASVRAFARAYGPEAIRSLITIARHPKTPPAVRVLAWDKVLDRGYGRPPQAITGEDGAPLLPKVVVHRLEMGEGTVVAIAQKPKENGMLPPGGES